MDPASRPSGSASSLRSLVRGSDGSLYDPAEGRVVTLDELRDDVRAGRRFRVRRHDTGASCTNSVVLELLGGSVPGVGLLASLAGGPTGGLAALLSGSPPSSGPRAGGGQTP